MNLRSFAATVFALVLATTALAADAPLPRHPAPSPDGSQIAFSWQGDLWTVASTGGEARRLTAHPADERRPIWSRDGNLLAFTSNRYGNADIFIMPADGSEAPHRLTHASVTDTPLDFTPDGAAVLFSSNRAMGIRWMPQLWTIPVSGGTPAMADAAFAEQAVYAPNGETMVTVRGATKWTRRGYRGPANRELWLADGSGEYQRLTTFDGDDDNPSWIGNHAVAFLSSRDGRKNVFTLDVVSGVVAPLTAHEGSAVRAPRAAADGSIIAYEFEDAIWTIPRSGGESTRLHLSVPADQLINPIQRRTSSSDATDLAVNPDGTVAAFIVHGDVFVTDIVSKDDQEIAKPPTVQVTDTPERESDLQWSTNGDRLLFTAAAAGAEGFDLYSAAPADADLGWTENYDFEVRPVVATAENERDARYSPAGDRIAFVRGQGDLVVADPDGGNETVLNRHFYPPTYSWSPDGKWIAYASEDQHANSEIFIVSATGGEPYNVSRHPDFDELPAWSPDGKRLAWASHRQDNSFDVWAVWLTDADDRRTNAEWLKVWNGGDEPEEDEVEEGDDEEEAEDEDEAEELPEVVIDFDRLWRRGEQLTSMNGDQFPLVIGPDGKRVVFLSRAEGESDLFSVRFDGEEVESLTEGDTGPDAVHLVDDTLFFINSGGSIQRIGLDGSSGDPVPFKARYTVDTRVEREVVFNEVWQALDENFYDSDFHGADWDAVYDLYRPWAVAASSDADFAAVLNLMLGELNASHMGYYPGGRGASSGGDKTGFIGAVFDSTAGGPGLLVSEVLPDSPADHPDAHITAGDRVLEVDGTSLDETTNVYSLFVDTVGERVRLTIQGEDGAVRKAVVRPVSSGAQRQLRYEEWVRQRRALVDDWSDDRLGYLHIQGMSAPSFEVFERDLFAAAAGKEGLIIDVRSNGGGWTTDYLMAVLMVKRHAYTVPRNGDASVKSYPTAERLPVGAYTRPAVTLCNEDSYSNAEIFSWAFQTLERGPLVGSPTFGAVISTGGTRLINGGWVRLPGRGWYVAGSDTNMEKMGAQPDVVVWQPPAEDSSATEDTQLAEAVRVRLDNIENDPRYGAW